MTTLSLSTLPFCQQSFSSNYQMSRVQLQPKLQWEVPGLVKVCCDLEIRIVRHLKRPVLPIQRGAFNSKELQQFSGERLLLFVYGKTKRLQPFLVTAPEIALSAPTVSFIQSKNTFRWITTWFYCLPNLLMAFGDAATINFDSARCFKLTYVVSCWSSANEMMFFLLNAAVFFCSPLVRSLF